MSAGLRTQTQASISQGVIDAKAWWRKDTTLLVINIPTVGGVKEFSSTISARALRRIAGVRYGHSLRPGAPSKTAFGLGGVVDFKRESPAYAGIARKCGASSGALFERNQDVPTVTPTVLPLASQSNIFDPVRVVGHHSCSNEITRFDSR